MEKTALKNYILDLENYLKLKGAETRPLNEIFKAITLVTNTGKIDISFDSEFKFKDGKLEAIELLDLETDMVLLLIVGHYVYNEKQPFTINDFDNFETFKLEFTEITPPTLAERVTALEENPSGGGGAVERLFVNETYNGITMVCRTVGNDAYVSIKPNGQPTSHFNTNMIDNCSTVNNTTWLPFAPLDVLAYNPNLNTITGTNKYLSVVTKDPFNNLQTQYINIVDGSLITTPADVSLFGEFNMHFVGDDLANATPINGWVELLIP